MEEFIVAAFPAESRGLFLFSAIVLATGQSFAYVQALCVQVSASISFRKEPCTRNQQAIDVVAMLPLLLPWLTSPCRHPMERFWSVSLFQSQYVGRLLLRSLRTWNDDLKNSDFRYMSLQTRSLYIKSM